MEAVGLLGLVPVQLYIDLGLKLKNIDVLKCVCAVCGGAKFKS